MNLNFYKLLKIALLFLVFSYSGFSQVGINTIRPVSTLDINGNISVKVLTLNGNGTGTNGSPILIDDAVYISLNPTVTNDKFQLPNPTLFPGRMYIIRNIQNTITAQLTTTNGLLFPKNSTSGSQSINMFEGNLRTVTVISDGFNWTYIN